MPHQFRRDEGFMLSNLKEVIDLGGDWLKNNVRDFFWVIRSPRFFPLSRFRYRSPLIEAAIFATFVSLLDLIISLPIHRQTGLQSENTSYLLVDTVLNVGYALICGSALHAVAVIFRGRGSYQATLVCHLYLTAFTPLTTLVSAPTQTLIARRTVASGDNVISVAFCRRHPHCSKKLSTYAALQFSEDYPALIRTMNNDGHYARKKLGFEANIINRPGNRPLSDG
jgi:hypothetical protein